MNETTPSLGVSQLAPSAGTRYVLMCAGSLGDTYPFISLANALQRRGRDVVMMGTAAHATVVARCGVPFVPVGSDEDYQRTLRNPDLWNPRKGFATLFSDYGAHLDEAAAAARGAIRQRDCVLIAHPLVLPAAALLRAGHPRLKIVGTYLAPSGLRTVHDPLRMGPLAVPRWVPLWLRRLMWRAADFAVIDRIAVPEVNAVRRAFSLPPIRHFIDHMQAVPDVSLTLFPPWFAAAHEDWPRPLIEGDFQCFDPSATDPLPVALEHFLSRGDAPLVVTPGSANAHAAHLFDAAAKTIAALGRRAIFLTPYRAQVPARLSTDVVWLPYVALGRLLPSAAGIVHHGGIGTTAEALRAGVPQLVTPFAWDQFDNAARVAELGVGLLMPAAHIDPGRMQSALADLLTSNAVRSRCAAVAAQCHQGRTADQLCGDIESAVGAASDVRASPTLAGH